MTTHEWEPVETAMSNVSNRAFALCPELLVLPGMVVRLVQVHLDHGPRKHGRLLWLVRDVSPAECLDWLARQRPERVDYLRGSGADGLLAKTHPNAVSSFRGGPKT